MLQYTVLQLTQMGIFIPLDIKRYVLSRYGMFTMNDFDKYFQLNDMLGKPYDNCYASIMSLVDPAACYNCLTSEGKLLFNIVRSAIKSPQGMRVWL